VPDSADKAAAATAPPKLDKLPEELLWLLDAPLFIDDQQVDAFYDAVMRPDYEGTSLTLSNSITHDTTFGANLTVGAALPWFAKTEAQLTGELGRTAERGRDVTLTPISNAYRHLLALAIHYATIAPDPNGPSPDGPGRLVLANTATGRIVDPKLHDLAQLWLDQEYIGAVPRALVFLDLPPQSKFIPAALELTDGEVTVLADTLGERLAGAGAAKYPGSTATEEEKDKYFQWFAHHFDDRTALQIVEQAVTDHPVAWINFNVSLAGDEPPFMHLNLVARGKYDTGVFAYNLVTRGFNYGLRLVGTLKSGPDMNVLAVFER